MHWEIKRSHGDNRASISASARSESTASQGCQRGREHKVLKSAVRKSRYFLGMLPLLEPDNNNTLDISASDNEKLPW